MTLVSPTEPCPFVVVDVDYRPSVASAAAIVATTWDASKAHETRIAQIRDVQSYQPGAFFKRELPCILDVLALIQSEYRAIVIDGYVFLDEHGRPGLGAHLHEQMEQNIPIIGVAKTAFHGSSFAVAITRGKSNKPLYVTACGIDKEYAAGLVRRMHGAHRLPTLLKQVDGLARQS